MRELGSARPRTTAPVPSTSRRTFLQLAGFAASWPLLARGQESSSSAELPLRTTGLEHLGLLVPDVASAGRFYVRVFDPALHKEREPPLRYYVPLGVGYIAIGAAGERPTQIDHYCALVEGYDPRAMAERLQADGLPVGRFGMIPDPDQLRLQLLRVPGGLATSTEPAGRIADEEPVVTPLALEHVLLRVSDLDRALPFYRTFFGRESTRTAGSEPVWFQIADTRLGLQGTAAGETPRIERFCVKVAAFDRNAVAAKLATLGATLVVSANDGNELRFTDPDGINVALRTA